MTKLTTAAAALAAAFALSATAQAGQQEMFDDCRAAIADAAGVDETRLEFKSISGASVKRVLFSINIGAAPQLGECKVRRGKVAEVTLNAF